MKSPTVTGPNPPHPLHSGRHGVAGHRGEGEDPGEARPRVTARRGAGVEGLQPRAAGPVQAPRAAPRSLPAARRLPRPRGPGRSPESPRRRGKEFPADSAR